MNQSPRANGEGHSIRRTTLSYLTIASHGSSAFIATFLLIHLSAPVLANLGGASMSSKVMILGREYYQTSFGEKILLLAPLIVHAWSGIGKRLLSSPPTKSPRPLSSVLTIAGYGALIFLPIHFVTHRLYPADSSMLDFEFVKLGLHKWPLRSIFLYGGLVGCVFLHAVEGINIIGRTWVGVGWKSCQKARRIAAAIAAAPVFTGLCFIFRERLMAFPSLARQYEAAFTRSIIYRW